VESHPAGRTAAGPTAAPTGGARPEETTDVYAHARAGMLGPAVRGVPERVYVPNSESDTVDVIDPATFRIVGHFPVGALPRHVVPS